MKKFLVSSLLFTASLLLGAIAFPVLANKSQPVQSPLYLAYPPPGENFSVYMPKISVPPPLPNIPQLSAIVNAEGGSFTIQWVETPKRIATSYTVQEAKDADFTQGVSTMCTTSQLFCALSGKVAGTYYYRVKGTNEWGSSSWSNIQAAVVLLPAVPSLSAIDNSDFDNLYAVNWNAASRATAYILQESTDESFSGGVTEYSLAATSWTTPAPGKYPARYYYRVKSTGPTGVSGWGNIQYITINPLFVGLKVRWDGNGYVRGDLYEDIGVHETYVFNSLVDTDTVRLDGYQWYDPNPTDLGSSSWSSYYSPSTGDWKSSNVPPDPSWKWGDPWFLPYTAQYTSGETVLIDGQKFTVTGPHDGYTSYGKSIKYWQFINQETILIWDDGGDVKQYAHAGDITLRYDAGTSRLLLYENILRRVYYQGGLTNLTVQYIILLSSSTSIPGSPPFSSAVSESIRPLDQGSAGQKELGKVPGIK